MTVVLILAGWVLLSFALGGLLLWRKSRAHPEPTLARFGDRDVRSGR